MQPKHYVTLKTSESLTKSNLQFWYKAVKLAAPNTVSSTIIMRDNAPKSVRILYNRYKNEHFYCVPLMRDLTEDEVTYIISLVNDFMHKINFEVTHSIDPTSATVDPTILGEEAYENLCQKLSKSMHQHWYQTKAAEGWRYGPEFSIEAQMHPMLLPWDSLPEGYRKINRELPKIVMDALRDEGFVVISEKELNKLTKAYNRLK